MGDKKLSGRSWRGMVYFLLVTSNKASLKVVWAELWKILIQTFIFLLCRPIL